MLTSRILATAILLVACKSSSKESKEKPTAGTGSVVQSGSAAGSAGSAAPAPKLATPEAKLARYQECLAAFNTGNVEVMTGCYGATSIREQVDSVPELVAEGPEKIMEMVTAQRASFPNLTVTPRVIVVSDDTIAAIHHVTGKNSVAAGGMKATNKTLGVFEAELTTMASDGTLARDSFFVDQPTVYHQLGLLPNDTSPGPIEKPAGEPDIYISKNDATETANKALVQKVLEAVSKKDAAAIDAVAAPNIKFTYHGEKQKIESKAAYMKWMREMLGSTEEGHVDVKGIWAAGDVVVVFDVFTGTPKDIGGQIKTNVVQFFRIADGKITQHQMFANRLHTAVQLGIVDPEQLMQTLAAAAK